jgi:hypothetical protein
VGNGSAWALETPAQALASLGVTATAAELNILDGVTATAAELNILDGVTATTAELNLVDGSVAGTIVNNKAVVYGAAGQVNATAIGANSITDAAGTGAPDFPNGLTATTIPAANLTGSVAAARITTALNASGSAPIFACRAWVNFDGTTLAIRASGNVSSITYNGVGQYAINFTTAMPDASFSAVVSAGYTSADCYSGLANFQNVSSVAVLTYRAGNFTDMPTVAVAIFR